ncbi:unnamed protein product, partial [Allacma fusca]
HLHFLPQITLFNVNHHNCIFLTSLAALPPPLPTLDFRSALLPCLFVSGKGELWATTILPQSYLFFPSNSCRPVRLWLTPFL